MAITPEDIRHIAELAQLELTDAEAVQALAQLDGFFALVEQMHAVDTSAVLPLQHPVEQIQELSLRLRDDVVTEVVNRTEFQRHAPYVKDGLYVVPHPIE
ncbi:Asp-tRNA(Asn)/Glu-tRNA(Gln) amidotransferase subunit GatC [Paraburkholderia fungorum]|uniref:Asp-tRNA(Asn)/Glu-tRNA(Gln) amidotransferase subunit GatC n=1 Tax=Paraburkholderia fungorum TaxID=134537 RepID=UPI00402BB120